MEKGAFVIVAIMTLLAASGAYAHRYIENNGSHTSAAKALPIGDIDLSQVVYHTVTNDTGQIWLSFEAESGVQAKIQLGVPFIERYVDYRPAFALLGPGLPPVEALPFTVPEGYGGVVYTTDAVESPVVFNEEFTGTKSWQFDMQTIELPETGLYYIVGFVPSEESGKFWIAPGTREEFGLADILTLPRVIYKVRTFHEVFPWGGILGWAYLGLIVILLALLLA